MDCTVSRLPYASTGYFTRLITDYLSGSHSLLPFFAHPPNMAGIKASIAARKIFQTDRAQLVNILKEQYQGLPVQPAVEKNIGRLADQNCFTVTTAHQPAIFTGTLYFVYKILHAVRLARELSEAIPDHQFVPVYYMGSEDADLDELGNIYLGGEKIIWDTKQTGAVGRMKPAGLEKIIQRIAGEFTEQPFGQELVDLLNTSYLQHSNIQEGTQYLLHHLFGSYGLLVLIPDHPGFKKQLLPVFQDDLFAQIPAAIAQKTISSLEKLYPVQAQPREINLFYLKDDIRERIEKKDDHFIVHHTSLRFTEAEMKAVLQEHPERFSPNVILRGLLQETILPNIAFIGGGGETAYWLELKAIFDHYKVPYPVLLLRNSFLFVAEKWVDKIAAAGLNEETIFQPGETLFEKAVKEKSAHPLQLAAEMEQVNALYKQIRMASVELSPTLGQHVDALQTRTLKNLGTLEKKMLRAEKRKYSDIRNRIYKIKEALFPMNSLQERIDNFIPYYARYGPAFFDLIYRYSLTVEQEFVVLEEMPSVT